MKFFVSDAGCGYQEYAYVTPINNTGDYLCIYSNEQSNNPIHKEGEIVKDLDDIYLTEVELDLDDYPITQTFLFKFFMENINQSNVQL